MTLPVLFFVLVGAVSLAAAIGVVTSRQPVHSALFLLTHFVTLAVLYITLDAQFLAATQVIIYAGGIVILILFVIMLIGSEKLPDRSGRAAWVPFTVIVLGLILIFSLVYTMTSSSAVTTYNSEALQGGAPQAVGLVLFTEYILPFQLVAVLLLVALLGALLLARNPAENES